jgi:tripartite-type tricarboxylate transporter receptor subunit TctC
MVFRKTALALLVTLGAAAAHSQPYPLKPVRVVVPTSPGGGSDIASRTLAPKLAEYLGQQFVIEHRPGAGTLIGMEVVARAAPNGYTLLMGISSLAIIPHLQPKLSFDVTKDFAPITQLVANPNMLVSHPSLPPRSVKELIAFVRARPEQVNYAAGSAGSNPHLAMELLAHTAGVSFVHVPYKGQGPAMSDVIGGHVSLMMANMMSALPHVRSGRLRALGITSAERAKVALEIPTVAEAGVRGYEVVQWFGLLAPAGTPREIVMTLHGATTRALQDPAVQQRFAADAGTPIGNTPEQFSAVIHADLKKWGNVIKAAGIRVY